MGKQRFINKIIFGCVSFTFFVATQSFTDAECQLTKEWESESIFLTPESVVFDSVHNCLYVSNFNDQGGFRKKDDTLYNECISKVGLDGNIQELRWVDSLLGPTGLAIYNSKLYIVERDGLSIVNIDERKIERRTSIVGAGFLNDIVIDRYGDVYISDSNKGCIYKIKNGRSEVWYSDTLMNTSNGLLIDNNNLLIGNRGAANLISISLTDKSSKIIAKGVSDNIDGIKKLNESYLLSWRSELFILEPDNKKKILFQSDNNEDFFADFEYIKEINLIIVPILLSNKVIAFKMNKN